MAFNKKLKPVKTGAKMVDEFVNQFINFNDDDDTSWDDDTDTDVDSDDDEGEEEVTEEPNDDEEVGGEDSEE